MYIWRPVINYKLNIYTLVVMRVSILLERFFIRICIDIPTTVSPFRAEPSIQTLGDHLLRKYRVLFLNLISDQLPCMSRFWTSASVT